MKVKRTIIIEREVNRCFHDCPYFGTDGNLMICEHHNTSNRLIISHPECDNGFPKLCPLLNPTQEKTDKCEFVMCEVMKTHFRIINSKTIKFEPTLNQVVTVPNDAQTERHIQTGHLKFASPYESKQ